MSSYNKAGKNVFANMILNTKGKKMQECDSLSQFSEDISNSRNQSMPNFIHPMKQTGSSQKDMREALTPKNNKQLNTMGLKKDSDAISMEIFGNNQFKDTSFNDAVDDFRKN